MASAILSLGIVSCGGGSGESTDGQDSVAVESPAVEETTVNVNLETSVVGWKGTMMGMYSHSGTVKLTNGTVTMAGNAISGGSFTVDLSTIAPTDSNYSKDNTKEKLVGHLGSPDFFDVANTPLATFEITGSDESGNVMGNLTVRGKTNPETVTGVMFDEATGTITGTLVFNRQNYGVAYKSTMKDMVLSDDIELKITLVKA